MFSLFIFGNLIIYHLGGTDFHEYTHKILQREKKEMMNDQHIILYFKHSP